LDAKLVDIAAYKSTVGIFSQSQGMDEIIPKINDFAQRIGFHILGSAASSTFGLPPAPSEAPQPQQAEGSKEAQIISGMRSSRKGTFTSAINPDFITGAQTPGKRTFWMSQRYASEFKGMDIGDVNGDGLNEVVVIEAHDVTIYQMKDGSFKQLYKMSGKTYDSYLAVDVSDINGNGLKEIFVTSITRDVVDSFVLEFRDGKFAAIASDLHWFLRVITPSGGDPILLGQRMGFDKPFDTWAAASTRSWPWMTTTICASMSRPTSPSPGSRSSAAARSSSGRATSISVAATAILSKSATRPLGTAIKIPARRRPT
jgi:hypothetical protein